MRKYNKRKKQFGKIMGKPKRIKGEGLKVYTRSKKNEKCQ